MAAHPLSASWHPTSKLDIHDRLGAPQEGRETDRRRAQAEAEVEEHDIDDMLAAISAYRRRAGRRDLGEELADELMRGTWDA